MAFDVDLILHNSSRKTKWHTALVSIKHKVKILQHKRLDTNNYFGPAHGFYFYSFQFFLSFGFHYYSVFLTFSVFFSYFGFLYFQSFFEFCQLFCQFLDLTVFLFSVLVSFWVQILHCIVLLYCKVSKRIKNCKNISNGWTPQKCNPYKLINCREYGTRRCAFRLSLVLTASCSPL